MAAFQSLVETDENKNKTYVVSKSVTVLISPHWRWLLPRSPVYCKHLNLSEAHVVLTVNRGPAGEGNSHSRVPGTNRQVRVLGFLKERIQK